MEKRYERHVMNATRINRRVKNHKVPIADAAGLTVYYPIMCNTKSSSVDVLS
jgi:hypothetical protein